MIDFFTAMPRPVGKSSGFLPESLLPMLKIYIYQKCSTCRDALKWLDAEKIPYETKAIRETPPQPDELRAALKHLGGDIRKLFNRSGMDYRALGLKDKLPLMSDAEAIEMLSQHGNLVKRPFVLGKDLALVGFKPDAWREALIDTISNIK